MSVRDNSAVLLVPEGEAVPEHDLHAQLVDLLAAGLRSRFSTRKEVAVHERLAWFPDRGDTRVRLDPDVMVVFGRPQETRSSWRQWDEDGTPPSVLIEVWSDHDTAHDYRIRLQRARHYGVGEIVLVEPFRPGGVVVSHLQATGDGSSWETIAVSADPDHPVAVASLGVRLAGGPTLVASDELGVWPPTGELLTRWRREQARAVAAEARVDQLAARLRAAGLDPDQLA